MKKILTTILVIILLMGAYFYFKSYSSEVYIAKHELSKEVIKTTPLLFTGDVMLGRHVETLMRNEGLDSIGTTTDQFNDHTIIMNLEGNIPEIHKPTPINGFTFSFPTSTVKYLKGKNVKAVSLANNHSFDHGRDGYENSVRILTAEGIIPFGSYDNKVKDFFETKLGTTTVIVYGINMITNVWDEQGVLETSQELRANHPDAVLIAYIHWGNEYDLMQGEVQRDLAHKLIDRGTDVIIGAHPHVVQGVEVYKNSPIFYSLGNFIFDQYFEKNVERGYLLSIDKKEESLLFKLIPVGSKRSQAFIAGEELRNEILNTVAESSEESVRENIKKGEMIIIK